MEELRLALWESGAAVLLLGGVIAGAQWLLRRIYGEHGED